MNNPNINRIVSYLITILGMMIAGISAIIFGVEPLPIMFYAGVVIAFGGMVYGILTIRCPHCQRLLHIKGITPDKYCPYCGKKIKS